jgi:hypothetical protein
MRQRHQHNHDAWMMYHGAALSQPLKKRPPLDAYLVAGKKTVKPIDEAAIMSQLKAYQGMLDNGDNR